MTNYLSTADRAAIIRKTLKAKGWTSRDVSVRSHCYSMGSSIYVTIKNPDVPIAQVSEVANQHERIDRDQFGEILSGGNRFVDVNYSGQALEQLGARHMDALQAAAAQLPEGDSSRLVEVGSTPFLLGRGQYGRWSLWGDSHIVTRNELTTIATELAIQLQGGRS